MIARTALLVLFLSCVWSEAQAVELLFGVQAEGGGAVLSDDDPSIGGEVPIGLGGGARGTVLISVLESVSVGLFLSLETYGHLEESSTRTYQTNVVLPSAGLMCRVDFPASISAALSLGYTHGNIYNKIEQEEVLFEADNDLNGMAIGIEGAYRFDLGLDFPLYLETGPSVGLKLLSSNDSTIDGVEYKDENLTMYWNFGVFLQGTYELGL